MAPAGLAAVLAKEEPEASAGSPPRTRFLIRDRDGIYGEKVVASLQALGVEETVIGYQSPWQNGYVERVIVFGERHLRWVLRECITYHHESRIHLGPGKEAPEPRAIQPRGTGAVTSEPVLGGLHHRYWLQAA